MEQQQEVSVEALQSENFTLNSIIQNLKGKIGTQEVYIARLEVEKNALIQLVSRLQPQEEEVVEEEPSPEVEKKNKKNK